MVHPGFNPGPPAPRLCTQRASTDKHFTVVPNVVKHPFETIAGT